jgi:hypothetical protein
MGNSSGKHDSGVTTRAKAITGGAQKGKASLPKLPPNTVKASPDDYAFLEVSDPACCGHREGVGMFRTAPMGWPMLCRVLWPSCSSSTGLTPRYSGSWSLRCLSET